MPIGIYPRASLEQRFWAKVLKTDSCWVWLGFHGRNGYGTIQIDHKPVLAHRLAYELATGKVLPMGHELEIDHLCRNRLCVNPHHLELVTHKENNHRGVGITALHARATHCFRGHPYDLFNTYHRPDGNRDCRACMKIRTAEYKARHEVEA